jgi:hypothetical protein
MVPGAEKTEISDFVFFLPPRKSKNSKNLRFSGFEPRWGHLKIKALQKQFCKAFLFAPQFAPL